VKRLAVEAFRGVGQEYFNGLFGCDLRLYDLIL